MQCVVKRPSQDCSEYRLWFASCLRHFCLAENSWYPRQGSIFSKKVVYSWISLEIKIPAPYQLGKTIFSWPVKFVFDFMTGRAGRASLSRKGGGYCEKHSGKKKSWGLCSTHWSQSVRRRRASSSAPVNRNRLPPGQVKVIKRVPLLCVLLLFLGRSFKGSLVCGPIF